MKLQTKIRQDQANLFAMTVAKLSSFVITKIVLFGSSIDEDKFPQPGSDIDIAIGIRPYSRVKAECIAECVDRYVTRRLQTPFTEALMPIRVSIVSDEAVYHRGMPDDQIHINDDLNYLHLAFYRKATRNGILLFQKSHPHV